MPLRECVSRLKEGTERLNYGRDIIAGWSARLLAGAGMSGRGGADAPAAAAAPPLAILDLGCGHGDDLVMIRDRISRPDGTAVRLLGIDAQGETARDAARRGIEVAAIDLERDVYPYPDGSIDLIIANQVLEHTKELFWIFSECSRILKPDGHLIAGVPNLASLHNRVLLLFGDQPSSIELLGPHVRGITANGFRRFVEADGIFRIEEIRGSNFYPFPPPLSTALSRLFPRLSVSLFFLIRKVHPTKRFSDVLRDRFFETNFYSGPPA